MEKDMDAFVGFSQTWISSMQTTDTVNDLCDIIGTENHGSIDLITARFWKRLSFGGRPQFISINGKAYRPLRLIEVEGRWISLMPEYWLCAEVKDEDDALDALVWALEHGHKYRTK